MSRQLQPGLKQPSSVV